MLLFWFACLERKRASKCSCFFRLRRRLFHVELKNVRCPELHRHIPLETKNPKKHGLSKCRLAKSHYLAGLGTEKIIEEGKGNVSSPMEERGTARPHQDSAINVEREASTVASKHFIAARKRRELCNQQSLQLVGTNPINPKTIRE